MTPARGILKAGSSQPPPDGFRGEPLFGGMAGGCVAATPLAPHPPFSRCLMYFGGFFGPSGTLF